MRRKLQLSGLMAVACILLGLNARAQVNYSENFNTDAGGWTLYNFEQSAVVPCEGAGGMRTNIWDLNDYSDMLSPSIGTSDGSTLILTYQYKLLEYATNPTVPVSNDDDWGTVGVFYSTSPTGPFTQIDAITPDNHVESATCSTRTVTFTPPAGSSVYIGIAAQLDYWDNDYFVFIDDINVASAPLCTGTPSASAAVASVITACDTQEISLSLNPSYSINGLEYQWQTSTDGTNFTDVAAGGDMPVYATTQAITTWYRAVISCSAGGDETTSTPVMVTSTGLPCYCDIEFESDIEPITNVNFAGIDNETSATINGSAGVQNFTALTPGEVTAGQTYTITVEGNTGGNYENYFMLYIDFNHNGTLDDEGEAFEIGIIDNSSGTDGQQATAEITIPATALPGITYMRVLKLFDEYSTDPCSSEDGVGYGQAEDYLLNVTAASGCATPAPVAEAEQDVCPGAIIGDLVAEGDTIIWYADATGGSPLDSTVLLQTGVTYYAAVLPDGGCESEERTAVIVTIQNVPVPTVTTVQPTCAGNDGSIIVTAPNGAGYTYSMNGADFQSSNGFDGLEAGTYMMYVQNADGCVSEVLTVVLDPAVLEAPEADAAQTVCPNSEVEELIANGTNVMWYANEEGGEPLDIETLLVDGATYYAESTEGVCLSERTAVTVTVNVVPAPTGDAVQTFNSSVSFGDVVINGSGEYKWYATEADALDSDNDLDNDFEITETTTLYVTQEVDGCESAPFAVTVEIVMGADGFAAGSFTYHPNPVNDILNVSYTNNIEQAEVYNLLGQVVLQQSGSQSTMKLDMSSLSAGTYLVKVTSAGTSQTIKVIKQ